MTLIRSKIAGIADIARDREKTKTQNLTLMNADDAD